MATDLERAFEALNNKVGPYSNLFRYADGNQPLVYSTDRLREAFRDIDAHFEQNWCAVVIDSTLDRLQLKGWDAQDQTINKTLDDIFSRQHIALDAYDAHEAALIASESFIIIWPAEDGTNELYYNDPRMCHIFYRADRPKVKEFAAKWWSDGARWYMTLYYPDRLEYYVTNGKDQPATANAFLPMEQPTAPNPYGVVPVFHLRVSRRSRAGELSRIITLQDAVNKTLADMMVASEFGAFKQRWVITNGDITAIANSPYDNWILPGGDGQGQQTSTGQFAETNLTMFLEAIDKLASSIAIISRTPKHFFFAQGGDPSGEALIAMESPLNKKVRQRQEQFGATWQEIGAFLLRLQGVTVDPADLTVVWEPAETVQPLTQAQVLQTETAAGIPLVTALKERGWSEAKIEGMQKDRDEEMNAAYQNAPEE
jgi:hypothetical protein